MKIILKNYIKFTFFLFLAFLFFTAANYFRIQYQKPKIQIEKQVTSLNFNSDFYKLFGLGLQRLYSSFLWIVTLAESDLDHYKKRDLNSWIFLRFQSIFDIDPLFYDAYLYGGLYLSVIKDDDFGAKEIYDRALMHFPNDKNLLFNAAFHYHLELFDIPQAIKLYERLIPIPGSPPYIPSLVSKLKADQGDLKSAFSTVLLALEQKKIGPNIKKRLLQNAYALKAEIDLNCLNQKHPPHKSCSKVDFEKRSYLFDKKTKVYKAGKKWERLQSYHKKKAREKERKK